MAYPLGKHGIKFRNVENQNNCVYLCELTTGAVKVGFSHAPQRRLIGLSRQWAAMGHSIDRFNVFHCGPSRFLYTRDPSGFEKRAIKALSLIAKPLPGTHEYFPIPYEMALAVVSEVITEA